MSKRSQHISGKSDRTTRISGGGLLGSQPSQPQPQPQPQSIESSPPSSVTPLFRSATDSADEDNDEDDFEPVASTSAATNKPVQRVSCSPFVIFNGQRSTKLSDLPPPPKKKAKVAASGKREYVEGEKEIGDPKGKGKGKAGGAKGKKGKENMEKLLSANVEFPPHFLKLEKTFKVSYRDCEIVDFCSDPFHSQALNTVYTFCSTRKSMATTFEVLKGSVENLLKRYERATTSERASN